MSYVLRYSEPFDLTPIARALDQSGVVTTPIKPADELAVGDDATVLLLDPPSQTWFTPAQLQEFVERGGGIVAIGGPDEQDVPAMLSEDWTVAFVPHGCGPRHLLLAIRAMYREVVARADAVGARKEVDARTRELGELARIGMALNTERDYTALQDLILSQARRLTSSDGGSLYLVEKLDDEQRRLRFKLTQNHSRPDIPFDEFTIPIDRSSIAGYVAASAEPVVIDDTDTLPPDSEFAVNRSFDQRYGYYTKSMLTIPMQDHKDQVIGVLQLINRKRDFSARLATRADVDAQVLPYSRRQVELVTALAGQAAVSIENSQLYEEIERLFEGFVRASVHAIEQRDPTTFGHSGRVADRTVALAEVVDTTRTGPYHHVQFTREEIREIRYAGLLHDFGKVGVREEVLTKANKLYAPELALVKQRYAFIRRTAERDYLRRRLEFLERPDHGDYAAFVSELDQQFARQVQGLERFMQLVEESNRPTVLPEGSFEELLRFAEEYFEDLNDHPRPYLTDDEVRYLTIRKGSLDDQERLEIESHVTHTFRFLQKIPWTKELRAIPLIAWGHHEKLDGTGYPRKLRGKTQIPIQTRMMTIADIFDALTAADRPYKPRMPAQRALDIMTDEVSGGQLDDELFRLFVDARVFERRPES